MRVAGGGHSDLGARAEAAAKRFVAESRGRPRICLICDHKPINFVGLYFIEEERDETGQIIAQISDGYYLAQFDSIEKGAPPPRLEVLSSVEFNKLCDSCGSRHWRFFADVESRKRWMIWLNTPDPANDKMGKVVHLKPKPEQPA